MNTSKIKYLSIDEVLAIHIKMVDKFGGSHGIRDLGLVESAVARPQASFGGQDLYENIFDKAAALLQSLLKNHPFVDGNKRTALTSAISFIEINGFSLNKTHQEGVEFSVAIDNQHLSIEQISKWLKEHSVKAAK